MRVCTNLPFKTYTMSKPRILLAALAVLLIASCAPGANGPIKDHMLAYNWKITYEKHNDIDITSTFSAYIFNFENNDVVYATKGDSTFTGSWVRSNASEDNPKVLLNFGSHYQLSLLNYDWQQDERSDNIIKFVDEQAATATEAVTFERVQ
jgi:hypothetical protein